MKANTEIYHSTYKISNLLEKQNHERLFTCSKLSIQKLEQGLECVQN